MAKLLPSNWRWGFEDLGDRIIGALRRWFSLQRRTDEAGASVDIIRRDAGLLQAFFSGAPLVDVEETDDDVTVSAELPGFTKDDFTVELTGQRLLINGEKKKTSGWLHSWDVGEFAGSRDVPR